MPLTVVVCSRSASLRSRVPRTANKCLLSLLKVARLAGQKERPSLSPAACLVLRWFLCLLYCCPLTATIRLVLRKVVRLLATWENVGRPRFCRLFYPPGVMFALPVQPLQSHHLLSYLLLEDLFDDDCSCSCSFCFSFGSRTISHNVHREAAEPFCRAAAVAQELRRRQRITTYYNGCCGK